METPKKPVPPRAMPYACPTEEKAACMREILSSGPERPPWKPPRWLIMAAAAVVTIKALVVGLIAANGDDAPQSATPQSSPSLL